MYEKRLHNSQIALKRSFLNHQLQFLVKAGSPNTIRLSYETPVPHKESSNLFQGNLAFQQDPRYNIKVGHLYHVKSTQKSPNGIH